MKKLALLALLATLVSTFGWTNAQPNGSAESTAHVAGATALFDYSYSPNEDENYMTLGMELPFDKLLLSIKIEDKEDRDENAEEESPKLQVEYRSSNNVWKKLSGIASPIQKDSYAPQLFTYDFEQPADFTQSNLMGKTAHWVRVTKLNDPTRNIHIDRSAARAYALSLQLSSSTGEDLTMLSAENFTLSQGTDNVIYGIQNRGDGRYDLALQTLSDDTSYHVIISAPNHLIKSVDIEDVNSKAITQRNVEMSLKVDCVSPYDDLDYHWAQSSVRELHCPQENEENIPAETHFYPNAAVTRLDFVKAAMERAQVNIKNYRFSDTPFRDVKDEPAVSAAWRLGYLDSATEFEPKEFITRGEAVELLVRIAGIRLGSSKTPFTDVSEDDPLAPYLRAAYNYQIIEGYADRTFKPENKLTKAEFGTMLNNTFYAWKE